MTTPDPLAAIDAELTDLGARMHALSDAQRADAAAARNQLAQTQATDAATISDLRAQLAKLQAAAQPGKLSTVLGASYLGFTAAEANQIARTGLQGRRVYDAQQGPQSVMNKIVSAGWNNDGHDLAITWHTPGGNLGVPAFLRDKNLQAQAKAGAQKLFSMQLGKRADGYQPKKRILVNHEPDDKKKAVDPADWAAVAEMVHDWRAEVGSTDLLGLVLTGTDPNRADSYVSLCKPYIEVLGVDPYFDTTDVPSGLAKWTAKAKALGLLCGIYEFGPQNTAGSGIKAELLAQIRSIGSPSFANLGLLDFYWYLGYPGWKPTMWGYPIQNDADLAAAMTQSVKALTG